MKIVFLIRRLDLGGSERQLALLAKGLEQAGHDVTVVVFYEGGPLDAEVRGAGIPLVALGQGSRWHLPRSVARLRRLLRRERTDVLLSYLASANVYAGLVKLTLPALKAVWSVRASVIDLKHYTPQFQFAEWLASRLSFTADRVVVNSEAGASDAVAKGYKQERLVVIRNGIDTTRFRPDPEARRRQREQWGIPPDCIAVGLVARLDPIKDHATFLEAAKLLAGENPEARFICAGGGDPAYADRLKAMTGDFGLEKRVLWFGAVDDPIPAYNALDIATSSSLSEGFSNTVAEAMSCGTPCVVTDVGDSARIVGDLGVVVPPKNPAALAEGWRRLLARRMSQPDLADAVRRRISENFSESLMVERTAEVLANVVRKGS